MSKYDDKVIPTLDDVIEPGVFDDTQIGDLDALEDDFDDDFEATSIRLDTSNSDSLSDDSFEEEFDKIALDQEDVQASTELDELTVDAFGSDIETDTIASINSEDFDQNITDMIIAERFPPEESVPPEETPAPGPAPALQETPAVDQDLSISRDSAAETIDTQTAANAAPVDTLSPDSTPAIKTEILISEVINEITRQLLPEIEWKIRTRVRDILEQHFIDKK